MMMNGFRLHGPEHKTAARYEAGFLNRPRIVAIPACNEGDYIAPCLLALAGQRGARPHKVVVWINNTYDDTYQKADSVRGALPFELELVRTVYDPGAAHAGRARRDAMAAAALNAPDNALLFTTDADGQVAMDWMQRTLEAFLQYDAEAVFGRALLLPSEAEKIPAHLHEDENEEQSYGALLDQIAALLDPDPHDPWPRHAEHSGSSIAVTKDAWERSGGIPLVSVSEDRKFYAALHRAGCMVRHALDVKVYVSARLVGRARGGMADTLARRTIAQDEYVDNALEPVSQRMLRIRKDILRRYSYHIEHQDMLTLAEEFAGILRKDLPLHYQRALRVLEFLSRTNY